MCTLFFQILFLILGVVLLCETKILYEPLVRACCWIPFCEVIGWCEGVGMRSCYNEVTGHDQWEAWGCVWVGICFVLSLYLFRYFLSQYLSLFFLSLFTSPSFLPFPSIHPPLSQCLRSVKFQQPFSCVFESSFLTKKGLLHCRILTKGTHNVSYIPQC